MFSKNENHSARRIHRIIVSDLRRENEENVFPEKNFNNSSDQATIL